jgi:hypothetical protein
METIKNFKIKICKKYEGNSPCTEKAIFGNAE